MYKVFINEKKLTLCTSPNPNEKNLRYEGTASIEMAVDLLENTSCTAVELYSEDLDDLWSQFSRYFKIIEASGGAVFNQNKELLCIFRLGKWDLPKGKIETNESRDAAALREVSEETALDQLEIKNFICCTYHIYRERNNQQVLKITYWYYMNYSGAKSPMPQLVEGITKAEWKTPDQIKTEVYPNTFDNIKLILKEMGF